jgi:hypothetical protein
MTKPSRGRRAATRVIEPTPSPIFHIEFILDETGSMHGCKAQTVAGFNDFLDEQRKNPGQCRLSLTKFQSNQLHTPYDSLDLGFVPPMTDRMFVPGGLTNLYDAIGDRIDALSEKLKSWTQKPNVLFVVMTDGQDNLSWEYNPASIRALLGLCREQHGWGFAYLGANQNAVSVGKTMGFLQTECRTFETAEIRQTMQELSRATTVYRAAATQGHATEIFR